MRRREEEAHGLARYGGQDRCHHGVPGGLHAEPGKPGHDCAYADARAALVPEAAGIANRTVGDNTGTSGLLWNRAFHGAIKALVDERIFHRSERCAA